MKAVEIICNRCGAEAFLTRESIYEGLSKTGETLRCSSCGAIFASEEDVPFKQKEQGPVVFTDADRSEVVDVFEEGEAGNLCHYCAHYVINPFMQFCSEHKKEVQATDSCSSFKKGGEKTSPDTAPF